MVLTNKQEQGLNIAVERFRNSEAYTCISGYAGSGKSTLVRFIVAALNLDPAEVAYVAFTGKASNVLKQKGNSNAITAHKLLYEARPKPDGTFFFIPKESLDNDYKLIIVDEVSMLPKEMWDLLLSYGVPVIAIGDPGQLPPVNPADDNHVLDRPHIFLDEIMRQAQESEIIRLSMHIREGNSTSTFAASNKEVMIINKTDISTGMYSWADQILCATNNTRIAVNAAIRKIKGFESEEPQVGDKVICLRNEWETLSDKHSPLTNGAIGTIQQFTVQEYLLPQYIYDKRKFNLMFADIKTEDNELFKNLLIDYDQLKTGIPTLTPRQQYQLNKKTNCIDAPLEFNYGYAITTHKAQGSQWDKVLVLEERFPFSAEEHKRWLYTAVTRSAKKLVLVKK